MRESQQLAGSISEQADQPQQRVYHDLTPVCQKPRHIEQIPSVDVLEEAALAFNYVPGRNVLGAEVAEVEELGENEGVMAIYNKVVPTLRLELWNNRRAAGAENYRRFE
ncbi:hypothetical protein JX265_008018 [Neoarthrinium moseri]|uniref:Uncharacterized protein n=1 Tax=Neoarthrinium moseri TaxID=1658444 RepID=A0A9P9WIZ0_9PEZI|nr:uncharacterized protein JN550_004536 [Neoarthrinium moseri]KAI1849681.1 hypothetical protein JX266_004630 [Neoarthrinium moseri]KAI1865695.1 hypothetical protein JX265_008018 [Neoarthrinium moseri]KAI1871542.1 hypothetical protein JN550_004536 [Neoarthrinium moseri]